MVRVNTVNMNYVDNRLGHVYSGVNIFTGKAVAIKFEPNSLKFRLLEHEASVYEHIAGCSHVPRVHWIGSDHNCDVLVMDLLGPSLEMLFTQSRRSLTVRRVSLFGIGLVSIRRRKGFIALMASCSCMQSRTSTTVDIFTGISSQPIYF